MLPYWELKISTIWPPPPFSGLEGGYTKTGIGAEAEDLLLREQGDVKESNSGDELGDPFSQEWPEEDTLGNVEISKKNGTESEDLPRRLSGSRENERLLRERCAEEIQEARNKGLGEEGQRLICQEKEKGRGKARREGGLSILQGEKRRRYSRRFWKVEPSKE